MAYPASERWWRLSVRMDSAQRPAGRGEVGELRLGGVERTDRAIGEGGEATVGIQKHPIGAEQGDRALSAGHNFFDRFDASRFLVDGAHAEPHVDGQVFQDL